MHIELSKQELKELKKLRAQIHRSSAVETIKEMFVRSEAFGNRVAVVEKIKKQDVVYTVKDFHDRVRQVGTALYELGLGGKHISIVSENSYNWIVVFFAIVCGGGVAVPIDKELPDKDISMLISLSLLTAQINLVVTHTETDSGDLIEKRARTDSRHMRYPKVNIFPFSSTAIFCEYNSIFFSKSSLSVEFESSQVS